ncbi:MAG: hypothetical protein K9H64_12960 [Bacteroidales bacterium]|nr:hypothetical protein [Bacteroidales bacterium]MCF8456957.1 hypothetical protein [Bacteroidales bacterium]
MKTKIIILFALCFGITFNSFAQNVQVTNDLNEEYMIEAIYVNGGNQITDYKHIGANSLDEIEYLCPSDQSYTLSSWQTKILYCAGTISAAHTYGTDSTVPIEDCGDCVNMGSVSIYVSNSNGEFLTFRCK